MYEPPQITLRVVRAIPLLQLIFHTYLYSTSTSILLIFYFFMTSQYKISAIPLIEVIFHTNLYSTSTTWLHNIRSVPSQWPKSWLLITYVAPSTQRTWRWCIWHPSPSDPVMSGGSTPSFHARAWWWFSFLSSAALDFLTPRTWFLATSLFHCRFTWLGKMGHRSYPRRSMMRGV